MFFEALRSTYLLCFREKEMIQKQAIKEFENHQKGIFLIVFLKI